MDSKSAGAGVGGDWARIMALALPTRVTLNKLLSLSVPVFSSVKWG